MGGNCGFQVGRENPLRSLDTGDSADKGLSRAYTATECGTRARSSRLGRVSEQRGSGRLSQLDLEEGCGSSGRVDGLAVV